MPKDLIQLPKKDFPKNLLEIPQPPSVLYLKGTLPNPEDFKYLCIVGARRNTPYGEEICKKLINGLSGYKIAIVSGLAFGIDSIAHREALKSGLKTVAIPGSGLDREVIYPASNRVLADKIVESGGALLSEFEPKFKPTSYSFPQRNRIMAGISDAVLIVEAERKSGTLITARLGLDYNKEVLAVPGSIFSTFSEGPNWLISRGALAISSSEDILEALGIEKKESGKTLENILEGATDEEKKIINLLKEPLEKDELIRESGLSTGEVNSLLSIMEIKGVISLNTGLVHLNISRTI